MRARKRGLASKEDGLDSGGRVDVRPSARADAAGVLCGRRESRCWPCDEGSGWWY
jgi:hypothetical protein